MRLSPGDELHADALLFDNDGTLVDSTAVVHGVWRRWAARHGVGGIEELLRRQQGRRATETLADYAHLGFDIQAEAARLSAEDHARLDGIVEVPGAGTLLRSIPGGRWAVVTSADRDLARKRLAAAGLPEPPVIVSAEDVRVGKPDPGPFLLAAERLGVPATSCVVFEDAIAGLAAGVTAGCRVIAVATSLTPRELERLRDVDWVPDLRGLRAEAAAEGGLRVRFGGW